MSETQPSRESAMAALAEADRRASQVRRADAQLAWILGFLVLGVLITGALMSVAFPHAGPAVLAVYVLAIALVAVVLVRIRVYSRRGLQIFALSASTFTAWNALGAAVSVATRWWAPSAPNFHFGITEAVAVLPLVAGIWLLVRRRS